MTRPSIMIHAPCVLATHSHAHKSHEEYFDHHDLVETQPFTCNAAGSLVMRAWIWHPIDQVQMPRDVALPGRPAA